MANTDNLMAVARELEEGGRAFGVLVRRITEVYSAVGVDIDMQDGAREAHEKALKHIEEAKALAREVPSIEYLAARYEEGRKGRLSGEANKHPANSIAYLMSMHGWLAEDLRQGLIKADPKYAASQEAMFQKKVYDEAVAEMVGEKPANKDTMANYATPEGKPITPATYMAMLANLNAFYARLDADTVAPEHRQRVAIDALDRLRTFADKHGDCVGVVRKLPVLELEARVAALKTDLTLANGKIAELQTEREYLRGEVKRAVEHGMKAIGELDGANAEANKLAVELSAERGTCADRGERIEKQAYEIDRLNKLVESLGSQFSASQEKLGRALEQGSNNIVNTAKAFRAIEGGCYDMAKKLLSEILVASDGKPSAKHFQQMGRAKRPVNEYAPNEDHDRSGTVVGSSTHIEHTETVGVIERLERIVERLTTR